MENYQQETIRIFSTSKDISFHIERSECLEQLILKRPMPGFIIMKSQNTMDRYDPEREKRKKGYKGLEITTALDIPTASLETRRECPQNSDLK